MLTDLIKKLLKKNPITTAAWPQLSIITINTSELVY